MKKHTVFFKKLREKDGVLHGMCFDNKRQIFINLMTSGNPAKTYIHELLHLEHPDWSETHVRSQEVSMWKKMNTRERFKVYHALFNRRYREKVINK